MSQPTMFPELDQALTALELLAHTIVQEGAEMIVLLGATRGLFSSPPAPQPSVDRVDVTPGAIALNVGQTLQLTASAYDASNTLISDTATDFVWTTSDAAKATVSSGGLVSAVAAGSANITATHGVTGIADTTPTTVAVTTVLDHITIPTTTVTLPGGINTLDVIADPQDVGNNSMTGVTLAAVSSNTLIATVAVSGYTVTITRVASTGSCTVDISSGAVHASLITATLNAINDPSYTHQPVGALDNRMLITGGHPYTLINNVGTDAYGFSSNTPASRLRTVDYNDASITANGVILPAPPKSASKVLEMTYPLNWQSGSAPVNHERQPAGKSEAYFCFWILFDASFHCARLPGVKGFFWDQNNGQNSFTNFLKGPTSNGPLFGVITQHNGAGALNQSLSPAGFGLNAARRGVWMKVELHMTTNTVFTLPGADGLYEVFVDDTLVFQQTNILYRLSGDPAASFGTLRWNPTFGGLGTTQQRPARWGVGASGEFTVNTAVTGACMANLEVGRVWQFHDASFTLILETTIEANTASILNFVGNATGAVFGGPKGGLKVYVDHLYASGL